MGLSFLDNPENHGVPRFPKCVTEPLVVPLADMHQQKITLRQIRRRCVLTHATLNLRPLRPVRPELRPLRPVRPELRPLCPLRPVRSELSSLRPVRPELPGNARSNSMRPEFPRNAGSHAMRPGPRCELLCVRMGGCLIAAF